MAGDNVSTLEILIESGATGGTGTVEIPYNADITDVTVVAPAVIAGGALTVALTKNGTSVFTAPLGTVASKGQTAVGAGAGIDATSTTLNFEFAGNGQPDIQVGAVLTIGTEQLLVTAQVGGSSLVDGATPVYAIPVQRAYNGTTAAAHAAGSSVLPTAPSLAIGAQKSGLGLNPAYGTTPLLAEGDLLVATLGGSFTTQAAGITVILELEQR